MPIRFLATEHGLAGRTSLEAAQADEIVDAITDMVNVRVGAVFEPDEAKKAEKMQAYLSQTLPTGLVRIFQKDYFCTIVTNHANQDRMEKLLVERGSQFMVDSLISIFVS